MPPSTLKSPPLKVTIYSGRESLLTSAVGIGDEVVNTMDMLSAFGKFSRRSPLPFSVLVRMYICI